MKIALLTDSDVFAGTERHILELAQALAALGCAATVLCPERSVLAARTRAAGLPVFAVEKRGRLDWRAVAAIRSALRAGRFDVVHTHNGRTSLLAALAVLLARRGRLVATQHFLSPAHAALSGARAALARATHRWVASRAARIIAISEAVRGSILARRAAPPGRVDVVLNGVSDPRAGDLPPRGQVRAGLGIADNAPLIVVSARLEAEKGIGTLLDALPVVFSRHPAARCLVAGEGSARTALQARLHREGLVAAVQLLGFRSDIFALIAAADVFVLPSPNEPFGLALIEAMALARPVVASRAGGPCEIVVEGESGLLFNPGDASDLAAKILRVLARPELAAHLSANARRRYAERFNARRMADEVLAIYREVTLPKPQRNVPDATARPGIAEAENPLS